MVARAGHRLFAQLRFQNLAKSISRRWIAFRAGAIGVLLILLVASARHAASQDAAPAVDSTSADALSDGNSARAETSDLAKSTAGASTGIDDLDGLLNKPLEDLARTQVKVPSMDVEVSTVNRTESTIGKTPAAVYVITNETIRRSGARSIMDALRLAPGVHVAKIDSNKYAISIRGFNGQFANKLLVQIDGRTVYTQLFAGTYWDAQDLLLEDVDRIEVIRGPGATIWGANAVNGVINILTKSAKETQGGYVEVGGGSFEDQFTAARYGGRIGEDLYWRAWGKQFERDAQPFAGGDSEDNWRRGQGGFRIDWQASCEDLVTFQGDYYRGDAGTNAALPTFAPPFLANTEYGTEFSGENFLGRWTRTVDDDTSWSVQTYFDHTRRAAPSLEFLEHREVFDIDFLYRFKAGTCHSFVAGAAYQANRDELPATGFIFSFTDPTRSTDRFSYFVQDEITLFEDLWYLTAGCKFVHNDFTDFEFQPSIRLLWTPDKRHAAWAGVSRAVRLPSRAEEDIFVRQLPIAPNNPIFPALIGNPDLASEQLLSFEVGWREQTTDSLSWDLALFFNKYEDLSVIGPFGTPIASPPGAILPLPLLVGDQGETYGGEWSFQYTASERWRLSGGYSLLRMFFTNATADGEDPVNIAFLHSSWDVADATQFDLMFRYVDDLPDQFVPSYLTMDARLAWEARPGLEFSVVGQNLLNQRHLEYAPNSLIGTLPTSVPCGVYGMLSWKF